ncbi:DUF1036 domain-containing protein [Ancylobacter terrae]|uniref:DUF1036 domain-containing protein n=1 Tax=Ancylobacter sp. sgz301288 TaxID=3342077 RepID=UPI0038581138
MPMVPEVTPADDRDGRDWMDDRAELGHEAGLRARRLAWRLAAGLALLLAAPAAARADLALCNHTSYVAEAALGIEQSGVRVTRGWFRLDPGRCRTVMRGEIAAERFFLHARALPLYGPVAMSAANGTRLCAGTGDFLIADADTCAGEGRTLLPFAPMRPTGEGGALTLNLAEADEYGDEQARFAALQRLLALLGYDPGPVDGTTGPKTDTALAAFLADRKLDAGAAARPDLLDRLLQAVREGEGPGLVWCNDTRFTVMTAMAREEKGADGRIDVVARGWWRIAPGRCLRAPDAEGEDGSADGKLYSYATALDADGAPLKRPDGGRLDWGGGVTLCTRASPFEIRAHDDCAGRNLDPTPFAPVTRSARGAAQVRFTQ